MPTPVRVRGKRGNKRLFKESLNIQEQSFNRLGLKSSSYTSMLEQLPNELLHEILWNSLNLDLSIVSPLLAHKLNDNGLRRRFVFLAFFQCRINDDLITFPHDGFGVRMDQASQMNLRGRVVVQPWFSFDLWSSCMHECFDATIPAGWRAHTNLHIEESNKGQTWSFLSTILQSLGPPIFKDLRRDGFHLEKELETPSNDYAIDDVVINMTRVGGSIMVHQTDEWTVRIRAFVLEGLLPGISNHVIAYTWTTDKHRAQESDGFLFTLSFGLSQMAVPWSVDESEQLLQITPAIPEAATNPTYWSAKSFHALLLLHADLNTVIISNTEQLQALSEGLAKAIHDRYLPAAYLLARANKRDTNRSLQRCFESVVHRLLQEIPAKIDKMGCQWLTRRSSISSILSLKVEAYQLSRVRVGDHCPVTTENLFLAMSIASADTQDVEAFLIYGFLAACFCLGYAERNEIVPQSILHSAHQIALESMRSAGTSENNQGMKCYRFLDAAAAHIINR